MDSFIEFLQHTSPITTALVIIGGLVHIVILLLKQTGVMGKIRNTQAIRTFGEIEEFNLINNKLDTIAGNHLHGLPDMQKAIDRLEIKSDKIIEVLTQINTKLDR